MTNRNNETKEYWFRAKRYGWGWGLPSVWQGWVIIFIYLTLIAASAFIFPPREELTFFISFIVVLSLILIAVCWIKGEPPRWRWRDAKNAQRIVS